MKFPRLCLLAIGLLCLATGVPGWAGVTINEFLANNQGGLTDADGATPGWIELKNDAATAADISGWRLTDDPLLPEKWVFPTTTTVPANGYLVVFASGKNRAVAGQPLHLNFQLDPDGEYLALTTGAGVVATEFAPSFPKQFKNVSYSVAARAIAPVYIAPGTAAKWQVPTSGAAGDTWTGTGYNDAAWNSGAGPLGYESTPPAQAPLLSVDFNIRTAAAADTMAGFTAFKASGATSPAPLSTDTVQTIGAYTVTVRQVGGTTYDDRVRTTPANSGSFTQSLLLKDFIFSKGTATGTGLDVIVAGLAANTPYAFSVWSYDSGSPNNRVSDWSANGTVVKAGYTFAGGTLPTTDTQYRFDFTATTDATGKMTIGGRFVSAPAASPAVFLNALQVLPAGSVPFGYAPLLGTNTQTPMLNVNPSLYARYPFTADPAGLENLRLRVMYDDGFVAYLNGTEVARRNAPTTPAWNSAATGTHNGTAAKTFETINIPPGALIQAGANVLAVQAMNSSAADAAFLISPALDATGTLPPAPRYYAAVTPGAANATTQYDSVVGGVQFSVDRGHYTTPQTVGITCTTLEAQIRYTTDGSVPTATTGTVYTGPLTISTTTVLRAAGFVPGWYTGLPETQSYIFPAQVAAQPPNPAGWPATWGIDSEVNTNDGAGNGTVPGNYEMDPAVTANTLPGYGITDALASLPTLSLVLPPGDFLGPNGIYQNPGLRDAAGVVNKLWEKVSSAEFIDPSGVEPNWHDDLALEIHGNSSRRPWRMQKHSLRLTWRSELGASKLRTNYNFFPQHHVREFNKLVLRGCFTDGWGLVSWDAARYRPDDSIYMRDVMMRGSHGDMGVTASGNRFVQVFINGLYWGMYSMDEHIDEDFVASHEGGLPTDWEVVSDFVDPDASATSTWKSMFNLLPAAGTDLSASAYAAVQQWLDPAAFADYYLLHIFGEAEDWPHHNGTAYRRKGATDKYRWLTWDQEIAFDNHAWDRLSTNAPNTTTARTAGVLYQRLKTNAEWRLLFADRAHKQLHNGGPLDLAQCQARWQGIASKIDKGIVAESARWGDTADETPYGNTESRPGVPLKPVYTREADWLPNVNLVKDTWLPSLHNLANTYATINKLRAQSPRLYPLTDPPAFGQFGGYVSPGATVAVTAPAGLVYFTTDGTDPREAGTGAVRGAQTTGTVTLNQSGWLKARALNGTEWSALTEAYFLAGNAASAANLTVSEIYYNPTTLETGDAEFIELLNFTTGTIDLSGVTFSAGITWTFPNGTLLGAGQRIVLARNGALVPSATVIYGGKLDNAGEEIALVGANGLDIQRFTYNNKGAWPLEADGTGKSLVNMNPGGNPDLNLPQSWRAGTATPNGTDGVVFSGIPDEDADADGLTALVEYALGTSDATPSAGLVPDVVRVPVTTLAAGAHEYLGLSVPRAATVQDVDVVAEFATDLGLWQPGVLVTRGLTQDVWRAPFAMDSVEGVRVQMRLKVRTR